MMRMTQTAFSDAQDHGVAVVIDGKIEARPTMYLALSYDHGAVDGRKPSPS